jgi:tetratricopeptide (TPR) repeat protein
MRTEYLKLTLLICLLGGVVIAPAANAQRRNKDREKESVKSESAGFQLGEESLAAEGMKFMMKDEPERAIPVFERLVQMNTQEGAGHYMLATALIKMERFDDAITSSKKAYDINKENVFYAQQLAELYAKRRKYSEAAQIYESLLAKSPENIQYGIELAAVYVFNDQFDKAIDTYNILEKSLGVTE